MDSRVHRAFSSGFVTVWNDASMDAGVASKWNSVANCLVLLGFCRHPWRLE